LTGGSGVTGGGGAPAATGRTGTPAFATQAEFLDTLRPHAEAAGRRLGVDADLLLAQAALETGWGRGIIQHPDGRSSHNLFGIKADGRWDGPRATVQTLEYEQGIAVRRQAPFRAYGSFAESFRDYADFILGNDRYQPALAQAASPAGYMRALQEAGYATDPQYAEKVLRVWREGVTPRLEVAARDAGGAGRPDA
jgi:flagellar protein FlgJ